MVMNRLISVSPLLLTLTAGCYVEGLSINNLQGTVTLPRAAATRVFQEFDESGAVVSEEEIVDVALIGPVYIGLYADLDYSLASYPHPVLGPQNSDTFPYGGTTLGDIRYACMEFFTCKLTSNRFVDFDAIVDWFTNVMGTPPTDAQGRVVETGEYIRQTCFDLLEVTADSEIRITPSDNNGDGTIDALDLDFLENEDGDFVGSFDILQQEFVPGMTVWAYMDAPDSSEFTFDSCDENQGYFESTYNRFYQGGVQFPDVLNLPSRHIKAGDWVSSYGYVWTDMEDDAELAIDFQVGVDEISNLDLSED
jgi:hypothetical protein